MNSFVHDTVLIKRSARLSLKRLRKLNDAGVSNSVALLPSNNGKDNTARRQRRKHGAVTDVTPDERDVAVCSDLNVGDIEPGDQTEQKETTVPSNKVDSEDLSSCVRDSNFEKHKKDFLLSKFLSDNINVNEELKKLFGKDDSNEYKQKLELLFEQCYTETNGSVDNCISMMKQLEKKCFITLEKIDLKEKKLNRSPCKQVTNITKPEINKSNTLNFKIDQQIIELFGEDHFESDQILLNNQSIDNSKNSNNLPCEDSKVHSLESIETASPVVEVNTKKTSESHVLCIQVNLTANNQLNDMDIVDIQDSEKLTSGTDKIGVINPPSQSSLILNGRDESFEKSASEICTAQILNEKDESSNAQLSMKCGITYTILKNRICSIINTDDDIFNHGILNDLALYFLNNDFLSNVDLLWETPTSQLIGDLINTLIMKFDNTKYNMAYLSCCLVCVFRKIEEKSTILPSELKIKLTMFINAIRKYVKHLDQLMWRSWLVSDMFSDWFLFLVSVFIPKNNNFIVDEVSLVNNTMTYLKKVKHCKYIFKNKTLLTGVFEFTKSNVIEKDLCFTDTHKTYTIASNENELGSDEANNHKNIAGKNNSAVTSEPKVEKLILKINHCTEAKYQIKYVNVSVNSKTTHTSTKTKNGKTEKHHCSEKEKKTKHEDVEETINNVLNTSLITEDQNIKHNMKEDNTTQKEILEKEHSKKKGDKPKRKNLIESDDVITTQKEILKEEHSKEEGDKSKRKNLIESDDEITTQKKILEDKLSKEEGDTHKRKSVIESVEDNTTHKKKFKKKHSKVEGDKSKRKNVIESEEDNTTQKEILEEHNKEEEFKPKRKNVIESEEDNTTQKEILEEHNKEEEFKPKRKNIIESEEDNKTQKEILEEHNKEEEFKPKRKNVIESEEDNTTQKEILEEEHSKEEEDKHKRKNVIENIANLTTEPKDIIQQLEENYCMIANNQMSFIPIYSNRINVCTEFSFSNSFYNKIIRSVPDENSIEVLPKQISRNRTKTPGDKTNTISSAINQTIDNDNIVISNVNNNYNISQNNPPAIANDSRNPNNQKINTVANRGRNKNSRSRKNVQVPQTDAYYQVGNNPQKFDLPCDTVVSQNLSPYYNNISATNSNSPLPSITTINVPSTKTSSVFNTWLSGTTNTGPSNVTNTEPSSVMMTKPSSATITRPSSATITRPSSATITRPSSATITRPSSATITGPSSNANATQMYQYPTNMPYNKPMPPSSMQYSNIQLQPNNNTNIIRNCYDSRCNLLHNSYVHDNVNNSSFNSNGSYQGNQNRSSFAPPYAYSNSTAYPLQQPSPNIVLSNATLSNTSTATSAQNTYGYNSSYNPYQMPAVSYHPPTGPAPAESGVRQFDHNSQVSPGLPDVQQQNMPNQFNSVSMYGAQY